jgi:hypothetical protein
MILTRSGVVLWNARFFKSCSFSFCWAFCLCIAIAMRVIYQCIIMSLHGAGFQAGYTGTARERRVCPAPAASASCPRLACFASLRLPPPLGQGKLCCPSYTLGNCFLGHALNLFPAHVVLLPVASLLTGLPSKCY